LTGDQMLGLLGNGILNFEGFVHWQTLLPAACWCAGSCGCFDQLQIFGSSAVTCLTLSRSFCHSSGYGSFWRSLRGL